MLGLLPMGNPTEQEHMHAAQCGVLSAVDSMSVDQ